MGTFTTLNMCCILSQVFRNWYILHVYVQLLAKQEKLNQFWVERKSLTYIVDKSNTYSTFCNINGNLKIVINSFLLQHRYIRSVFKWPFISPQHIGKHAQKKTFVKISRSFRNFPFTDVSCPAFLQNTKPHRLLCWLYNSHLYTSVLYNKFLAVTRVGEVIWSGFNVVLQ